MQPEWAEPEPSLYDDEPALGPPAWLIDAAALLAEPDPGPTPWLVEGLIVDGALVAAVGRWKTTKSYALLDLCIAVATGRPAFGRLEIPNPGPVVFINEESGRTALWRRLDALCRGRAIDPGELRGRLYVAANARVKLDDEGDISWQTSLLDAGRALAPRLFVFDPLARMKGAARDENAQNAMATVLEFLRVLRDETGAAVCFVHHTGHQGDTMRGSSDLESVWESRLSWKRDGQSPLVELASEHREAEAGDSLRYRIAWDGLTRSMRFDLVDNPDDDAPTLADRILDWLRQHGPATTAQVRAGVNARGEDVQRTLEALEQAGNTHRGSSGRTDKLGRPIRDKAWNVSNQAPLWPFPDNGNTQEHPHGEHRGSVAVPVPLGTGRTEQPPDDPEPDLTDEVERLLRDHADLAGGAA